MIKQQSRNPSYGSSAQAMSVSVNTKDVYSNGAGLTIDQDSANGFTSPLRQIDQDNINARSLCSDQGSSDMTRTLNDINVISNLQTSIEKKTIKTKKTTNAHLSG